MGVTEDDRRKIYTEIDLKDVNDGHQRNTEQKHAEGEFDDLEKDMHQDHDDGENADSD
jgi:hypothetical protein